MSSRDPAIAHIERDPSNLPLGELVIKTVVTHTVTYFAVGVVAMLVFGYEEAFNEAAQTSPVFRGFDDPLIMAGPLFQPIRGILFGFAFYPLRSVLFARPYGWLILTWTLIVIGIWSAFGPAPRSIEGAIYTNFPIEILNFETEVQALSLSGILWMWVQYPKHKLLTALMWALFTVVIGLISLGLLQKYGLFPT